MRRPCWTSCSSVDLLLDLAFRGWVLSYNVWISSTKTKFLSKQESFLGYGILQFLFFLLGTWNIKCEYQGPLKGLFINLNLTSFVHMLNFVFIRGLVSFSLVSGHRGLETSKPLNLSKERGFNWGKKLPPHLGAGRRCKGTGRMYALNWGPKGAAPAFFAANLEVLGGFRPLWPKWNLPHL